MLLDGKTDNSEIAVCRTCGKKFAQVFSDDYLRYSNYIECKECRRIKVEEKAKEKDEPVLTKIKYTPYKWQEDFISEFNKPNVRVGVVAGGARSGKDYMSVMIAIKVFELLYNEFRIIYQPTIIPSFRIVFIAPIEKIARQDWLQLIRFFPKEWIVSVSDSTMEMATIGGGIIEVRSAYDPQSIVGFAVDFAVITEGARIKRLMELWGNIEDRINSPGVGIGGGGGKVIVNSSPLGKNEFYKMFCWGQRNHPSYSDMFYSIQVPSDANPEVAKIYARKVITKNGEEITYKEDLQRRKGRQFLQDNLAQFLDSGGVVFPNFREKCVIDIFSTERGLGIEKIKEKIKKMQEPTPTTQYFIGYDPATGSSKDSPVLVVRNMETNVIIKGVNLDGLKDDVQLDVVASWSRYYNNATVCALTLGVMFVQGQLEKRGVLVIPLTEAGHNKRNFVLSLQMAVQNQDVTILDDGSAEIETLIFQMEDYTESPTTSKFSNQTQPNDDYVSALYAVYYNYSSYVEEVGYYNPTIRGVRR